MISLKSNILSCGNCFDQSYIWLAETIIGIRGKQFSKKGLILANGQLIFRLVSFLRGTLLVFFPSSGKLFLKEILIFAQCNLSLELIMVSIGRKKAVNKIILFPIYINSDSTSNNEGFVKKIRFHYADAEKLLSQAGISKKTRKATSNRINAWKKKKTVSSSRNKIY